MTKGMIWLLSLLMLVLAGCGKNAPEPAAPGRGTDGTPGGTPSGPVDLGPLKLGDLAKVGPIHYRVDDVEWVSETAGLPAGFVYALVHFTVKNESKVNYTINVTDHLRFESPELKRSSLSTQASALRTPRLQGTLAPGEEKEGYLGFMVKPLDGLYTLAFTHSDYGKAVWEFTYD
jgi:hypothetical protein